MGDPLIPGGYYLKARCIAESDVAHCAPVVRELWDYLLRNANHRDAKYSGRTIKRGQLFRTLGQIRDDISWSVGYRKQMYSEDAMKKAMKKLRSLLMIESAKAPGGVLITICNYCKYQDPANYEGTSEGTSEGTNEAPGRHQGGTHNKNEENGKKVKKEKKTPKPRRAAEPAPPLIEALRLGMGRYPAKHTWDAIQEQVNGKELDLALVTQHAAEWVANGWNRTNYIGALRYHMEKTADPEPEAETYEHHHHSPGLSEGALIVKQMRKDRGLDP
jgi:hypothetical protein